MAWKYWNKKQKKVFVILIIVLIVFFILAIPHLKGRGIPGIARIIALLLFAGIVGIVDLFKNDYEENVLEGDCVKCNRSCQTIYYEKSNKVEYHCPTCGKYNI